MQKHSVLHLSFCDINDITLFFLMAATNPLNIDEKVLRDYLKFKGIIPKIYSKQWLEKMGVPKNKWVDVTNSLGKDFFVKGKHLKVF